MYDSGRGAIVVKSPPLRAGATLVWVSRNRQQYRLVPCVFLVNYATRLHVSSPKAGPGATRGSPLTLHYAAVRTTAKYVRKQVIVKGVSVVLDDATGKERAMIPTDKFGRYGWKLVHEVRPKQNEIGILRFRVYYEVKVDFPPSVAPLQVVDPGFYDDDNFEDGWTYKYLAVKDDKGKSMKKTGTWLETAGSALKGGSIWNRRRTVRVHMEGTANGVKKTVRGKYNGAEGVVSWHSPKAVDGTVRVQIAVNGIQYTCDDVSFTYDSRYALGPTKCMRYRLVPEALMKANITYPFNIVGRKMFDRRIVR